MCLLALYFQQFPDYPLVVAANRDEVFARPSVPPQILRENPVIYGGRDLKAGGTWLGINEHGLLVGVLNRRFRSDQQRSFRSRGLLCLDLLGGRNAAELLPELERQQAFLYRPFNLVFADPLAAYVAYNAGERISWVRLERGLHLFGNRPVYDSQSGKLKHAHLLFDAAKKSLEPNPALPSARQLLQQSLSDHTGANGGAPKDAICVHTPSFGTVSSSLVFYRQSQGCFTTYYAPGPPCQNSYAPGLSVPSR